MKGSARDLYWEKPPDLPLKNVGHIVDGITASTAYEATYVSGPDLPDGRSTGRVRVTQRRPIPPYLEHIPIDTSLAASERWIPLQNALSASRLYADAHTDDVRSQAALTQILQRAPGAHVESEHEWLEELRWAVGSASRGRIASVAGAAEQAFATHFGAIDPLAYVRSYEDMAAFQLGEVLAKFEVMNPAELVKASLSEGRPSLVLEDGPNHGNANHFLVPMSATFPMWMGTPIANVSYWVLFVLRQPRDMPLLDVWHRDRWQAWIGSWYREGMWEPLSLPQPAAFVRWYVNHYNNAIRMLLDPSKTADISGQIRPMRQLAMTRFFFHLHDLIGRLAMTSDPYTRFLLAFTALDRFDALGWSYDTISSSGAMELAMKPLTDDPEFGAILGPYAARTWARSMRGLAEESAGTLSDDLTKVRMPDRRTMATSAYLADFLRRLRNTIHSFDEAQLRGILGTHSGRVPTSFAQFWVLLWLRLLVDPGPLAARYR